MRLIDAMELNDDDDDDDFISAYVRNKVGRTHYMSALLLHCMSRPTLVRPYADKKNKKRRKYSVRKIRKIDNIIILRSTYVHRLCSCLYTHYMQSTGLGKDFSLDLSLLRTLCRSVHNVLVLMFASKL